MPQRQPGDPALAPLRTATSHPTRNRQQRDLFAPALSRRPTSRATPRVNEDEVLADPESGEESGARRQRQQRRVRQGSRTRPDLEEQEDIVNRGADGGYLRDVSASNDALTPLLFAPELQGEIAQHQMDDEYADAARSYFTTGSALGSRGNKKQDDEIAADAASMMQRMRELAIQKMEAERWMFESLDRFQPRLS